MAHPVLKEPKQESLIDESEAKKNWSVQFMKKLW
jgi:hypothetical protein